MARYNDGYLLEIRQQVASPWFSCLCDLAIASTGSRPGRSEQPEPSKHENLWFSCRRLYASFSGRVDTRVDTNPENGILGIYPMQQMPCFKALGASAIKNPVGVGETYGARREETLRKIATS